MYGGHSFIHVCGICIFSWAPRVRRLRQHRSSALRRRLQPVSNGSWSHHVTETYARISSTTVMLSLITNELVYRKIHYMFPGGRCVVHQSDCQWPNITSCVQSDWRSNFQQNLGINSWHVFCNYWKFRSSDSVVVHMCVCIRDYNMCRFLVEGMLTNWR